MDKPKEVRISIGNIAMWVQEAVLRGNPQPLRYFGVANPKMLKHGVYEYQALGGAAQLTKGGKTRLERTYEAHGFEKDEKTGTLDARFFVNEEHAERVLHFFENITNLSNQYELDPTKDILSELFGAESGYTSLVSSTEREFVLVDYVDVVQQKPAEDGVGTSERSQTASVPTLRLFRRYKLVMLRPLMDQFFSAPTVRELTKAELHSTRGGARKGHTSDGRVIRDNLFL